MSPLSFSNFRVRIRIAIDTAPAPVKLLCYRTWYLLKEVDMVEILYKSLRFTHSMHLKVLIRCGSAFLFNASPDPVKV
jgi:hypothetical protein